MNTSSPFPANPVLIVDDEDESLRSYTLTLRAQGISHLVTCRDSRKVSELLSRRPFDVMLLDLTMPFLAGEEILSRVRERYPEVQVIVVTAMDEVATAVSCMKQGAFDYMVKPVEPSRLVSGVRRAIEMKELRDQSRHMKEHLLSGGLRNPGAFSDMITRNKAMASLFQYVESIAASRQPILVTGETGVGKELMVKAIHALYSPKGPLVSINVAGLDDNVFSDTLFGHVKGAYTGAAERRQGLVEKAAGGILHLDEIGDLSHESQVKLLRLLQEGEYFPLGSDTVRMADIRVIASTNRDLSKSEESRPFRRDLYYRLSVHHIHIPPLRQRRDDLPPLVSHFVLEAARSLSREPPRYGDEVLAFLAQHNFPGNIRELRMIIHDAVIRGKGEALTVKDFKGALRIRPAVLQGSPHEVPSPDMWWPMLVGERLPTIEEAMRHLIREALMRCNNNQSEAARLLGISRQRLARKLGKLTL